MLRQLFVLAFLTIFLVQCSKGLENPNGKCYKYNNRNKTAPLNCCDREILENPCDTVDCSRGEICELVYSLTTDTESCSVNYDRLQPECRVQCNAPKFCDEECHVVRSSQSNDGCDFCVCAGSISNDPCQYKNVCNKSDACVLESAECIAPPCPLVVKCVPRVDCSPVENCPANCLQYKDDSGCRKCHCCNACVNHTCPEGKTCVLEQPECEQCPCPPVATCV